MATITAGAVYPVTGGQATATPQSGTFIPTIWSAKLAAKFYTTSTIADITNRDWEGDIKNMGDKVIINQIPDLAIANYVAGAGISYQSPTPSTIEMVVDKGKSFAFRLNDVMAYQAQPNLMDMFSNDASEQMKIGIDSNVLFNVFDDAATGNYGATAGVRSSAIVLGTTATSGAIDLATTNALTVILRLATVLDEQNVPESDRFVLIDPMTRLNLMGSNLAQAYFTGDDTSIVRNGRIGAIDRFTVYVTNNLPYIPTSQTYWKSGAGDETGGTVTNSESFLRRCIIAGHRSAISFATQITKTETLRDPNDFGDLVRGLQVYGFKTTKPEALAYAVVKG